ncbi:hypothetical protein [Kribbella catacumbae]|uniref:hypothetical protein n=1 Tax=Kribbella catacumbae TaxID=460086 RepID=UPI00037C2EBD|nr:hypothetical protein [Kribbella catacumbae]
MSSSRWKVHFRSAPSEVYRAISTPLGRSRLWAESAKETNGVIHFVLPDGKTDDAPIEQAVQDQLYAVRLLGHRVAFTLTPDEKNGTDLTLTLEGGSSAAWVSLLLRLKGPRRLRRRSSQPRPGPHRWVRRRLLEATGYSGCGRRPA